MVWKALTSLEGVAARLAQVEAHQEDYTPLAYYKT